MKQINLKDYSLVNVKELDERIDELMRLSNLNIHNENDSLSEKSVKIQDRLKFIYKHDELLKLKQSLIPSEKLAKIAFDKGVDSVLFSDYINDTKLTEFLSSTIEID